MAVGGVGKVQVDRRLPVIGLHCLWKAQAQQRDLGPRDAFGIGTDAGGGAVPFLQDAVRPQRVVKPRLRQIGQDLAQDGGEQHIGVQDGAHQSSRKNSALR